jgi:FecR protein
MINQKQFFIISILILVTFSVYASGDKDISSGSQSGILTYLEGEVFINISPGSIGNIVKSSDTIRTGEDSYCEIMFGEANIFRLDENTTTKINWTESDIKLEKGSISAVFTKLDKFLHGDKEFTVTTPSNVAGVRGTVFFIKVENENNTYLCICNGALTVVGPETDLDIASDHHKAFRFTKKGDTVLAETAELLYHNDGKMDSVAEKIEYEIPWNKKKYSY